MALHLGVGIALLLAAHLWVTRAGTPGSAAEPARAGPSAADLPAALTGQQPQVLPCERAGMDESADAGPAALRVEARILDLHDRPLPGAELAVRDVAGVASARADGEGRAQLELTGEQRAQLDGELRFEVRAPAHALLPGERALPAASTLHLGVLRLAGGGALHGTVVDAAGAPIAGARVVATPWSGGAFQRQPALRRSGPTELHGSVGGRPLLQETRCAADGGFRLAHVEPGYWVLWAQQGERTWAWSERVALSAGGTAEVRFVLGPPEPELWIGGTLRSPDGAPVAGELVSACDAERKRTSAALTDADGSFLVPVEPGRQHLLTCEASAWSWVTARLESVPSGARGVELRFGAAEWLHVEVRDAAGAPVSAGEARAVRHARDRELPRAFGTLGSDGRARLHRPREAFLLRVDAPGFRTSLQGPFDPADVAQPLRAVLERGPAVRGRVRGGGEPLAGARVSLRAAAAPGDGLVHEPWTGEGAPFVHAVGGNELATARTRADGAFTLPLPPAERDGVARAWCLVADSEGFASQVAGPFAIDPERGLEDVELALSRGGTVRGTLAVPAPHEAAAWSVCASDGLGGWRRASVGPDGAFLLEHLRAGDWQVRAFAPGAEPPAEAVVESDAPARPLHDVRIEEGATAELRLVVQDRRALLVARLTLDGGPPGAWLAYAWDGRDMVDTRLAPDGSFALALEAGPDVRLTLECDEPGPACPTLEDRLDLPPGRTPWTLDLRVGTVRGRAPGLAGGRNARIWLLWRGAGELSATESLRVHEDGAFGPIAWPAGKLTLHPPKRDGGRTRPPDLDATLLTVELAPGQTLELDVP